MTSTDDVTENPESPIQVWPINILLQKKKAIKWLSGGRSFQQCRNNWIFINKKLNLDLYFTPYTKIIWNSKVCAQSHPTLCDPTDCSPPGFSVHGISQARILDCHALLQRSFLTQGSNPNVLHLLHWPAYSLPLVPPRKGQNKDCYWLLWWLRC